MKIALIKRTLSLAMIPIVLAVITGAASSQSVPTPTQTPGPYIVPVDYDALYAMDAPPTYEPFDVYGWFLMAVAMQQTPLVMDLFKALPDHIDKSADVVFKEVDGQKLGVDIYRDRRDTTPNPLILIIHGGYWKSGDKATHQFNAIEFVDLGYTVASVNYRLSADATFPANVEDIYDAIRFLTTNAAEYNIDPARIATWGGSAGGHLSGFIGLAANTADRAYNRGIDAGAIKAVISMYGMHDLTLPMQREHPFTKQYIGADYKEAAETYREASPITHADPTDPPVLLVHGSLDGSVSVLNSDTMAKRLQDLGVTVVYDRVEGWPHGMDFFSPIGERTLWHVYQFLKENMPSDEMK